MPSRGKRTGHKEKKIEEITFLPGLKELFTLIFFLIFKGVGLAF